MINRRNQIGLTLIEVMVSITLGVAFLSAAMGFLITSQQSSQSQESGSRIQENARFAMEIIRQSVQMAGFSQGVNNPAHIYRGSCGTVNSLAAATCSDDVAATATTQGDRLALEMTSPNATDCLGSATGTPNSVFANVFWVEINEDISSLYCQGYDTQAGVWIGAKQPLIDGIEQMQVQYGIFNNATGLVDRYLNATDVQALGTAAWLNVRAVKVGLLVSSGSDTDEARADSGLAGQTALANAYTNFTILDSTYTRVGDRRVRRVYTNVIAINN